MDKLHRAVDDQRADQRLAENPCQAGDVGLEIIYVTGNGDPHRKPRPRTRRRGDPHECLTVVVSGVHDQR
ncbi:hypothetical protein acdb102_18260 [Acidothermaceae bacterium B102]|nr:hypothetical protein acdb102_18260 [Acidothermaceae bacterium B102]